MIWSSTAREARFSSRSPFRIEYWATSKQASWVVPIGSKKISCGGAAGPPSLASTASHHSRYGGLGGPVTAVELEIRFVGFARFVFVDRLFPRARSRFALRSLELLHFGMAGLLLGRKVQVER